MTVKVPNPEVLQAAFASIQANLHAWDQAGWILTERVDVPSENTCGTTACLAGWIMLNSGKTPAELSEIESKWWAGVAAGEEDSIDDIRNLALKALGFHRFAGQWSQGARDFQELFYSTFDPFSDSDFAFTIEAFEAFKAKTTKLTGIEL